VLAPVGIATILLVEDDADLRDMYRQALLMSRYSVAVAGDGLTALALLEVEQPDVVILDLGLPRVSGWDVYRDLRARPHTATLPVIIVTGNDLRDIRPEDVVSFLQKPVAPERLVAAVERALKVR
jgi:DNA-binding response OmpR family regulator